MSGPGRRLWGVGRWLLVLLEEAGTASLFWFLPVEQPFTSSGTNSHVGLDIPKGEDHE